MNQKQLMQKRNDSARLLEHTSSIHRNCVRFNADNGIAHEMKKAEVCYHLKEAKIEFVCEAEFYGKKTGRADILILDECVALEIVDSESMESIEKKKKKYPCRIVVLRVGQEFKEEILQ